MMEFLKQNCSLTLRQGLEEFYLNNPEVALTSKAKGKTFIDHDLTHVIFGCDASVYGEMALKSWILFGTTITFQEVKDYSADDEVKRLGREAEVLLGGRWLLLLKMVFVFLPQFIYGWFFYVRKMHQKWPHSAVTDEMLDTKIADLRERYGITLLPIETWMKKARLG